MQRRLGTTARADRFYDDQMLDHLNERMREFVGQQEMFFLATSDRHGECDNSFRAGPPGFLHVVDERTLVYPEYRGNGVHASLGNIEENPHLGILLIDFFRSRVGLHINGRAEVVEDAEIRRAVPDLPVDSVPGRRALVWVRVTVEEAYIHCAKHIPHLQKAPKGTPRDWGTDDHRRKGGDFFGVAEGARGRAADHRPNHEPTAPDDRPAPVPAAGPPTPQPPAPQQSTQQPPAPRTPDPEPASSEPVPPAPGGELVPAGAGLPDADDPTAWQALAERILARALSRGEETEQARYTDWFG
ncbi:hypothetical protein F0L17_13070 [Streptomyces sp. TRM43335]|uniref:Pyridoxamine 5'-phosphate oxidase N-terminal domain-containing protein n=1 Tax=Streptomyces taklimakanensis TaxID=2569853 RepID=A0A6G2BCM3_9ACTN|nr:hypothetical protein [Streptomyces taklimakanensis]